MALQISSSAPSPSPSSSDSDGGANRMFSPTGSPPLILAFLAIGLFSAAMITVFGWRRLQFGRGWVVGPGAVPSPERTGHRGKGVELGEKPQLWDLWTDCHTTVSPEGKGCIGGRGREMEDIKQRWATIMPFSVTIFSDERKADHDCPNTAHGSDGAFGFQQDLCDIRERALRLREKMVVDEKRDERIAAGKSPRGDARLQAAVAIALPSPRSNRIGLLDTKDPDPDQLWLPAHQHEKLIYSIGLVQVPWQKEDR